MVLYLINGGDGLVPSRLQTTVHPSLAYRYRPMTIALLLCVEEGLLDDFESAVLRRCLSASSLNWTPIGMARVRDTIRDLAALDASACDTFVKERLGNLDFARSAVRMLEDVRDRYARPISIRGTFAGKQTSTERRSFLLAVAAAFLTTPMH